MTSLKADQAEIKKALVDLKRMCEDLGQSTSKLNYVILDMKVEEGFLKVINDYFGGKYSEVENDIEDN